MPSGPLRENVWHMLKWLDLLKRINWYYHNIVIPTLERAQIVTSEFPAWMEDTIGSNVSGVRSVPASGSEQPSADKPDSNRAGDDRDSDDDSDEEWMDTDDLFPTGDRRHGPVSVDDPNFGTKINLILTRWLSSMARPCIQETLHLSLPICCTISAASMIKERAWRMRTTW